MGCVEDSPTVALDAVDSGGYLPLHHACLGGKLGVVNFISGISPHGVSELKAEQRRKFCPSSSYSFSAPFVIEVCSMWTQFIVCYWKNQKTLWQLFVQRYLLLKSKDGDADKNNKTVN